MTSLNLRAYAFCLFGDAKDVFLLVSVNSKRFYAQIHPAVYLEIKTSFVSLFVKKRMPIIIDFFHKHDAH